MTTILFKTKKNGPKTLLPFASERKEACDKHVDGAMNSLKNFSGGPLGHHGRNSIPCMSCGGWNTQTHGKEALQCIGHPRGALLHGANERQGELPAGTCCRCACALIDDSDDDNGPAPTHWNDQTMLTSKETIERRTWERFQRC